MAKPPPKPKQQPPKKTHAFGQWKVPKGVRIKAIDSTQIPKD